MTTKSRPGMKRSIGTLPDGNHAYLQSLRKFITWINKQENPSRTRFLLWLQEERPTKENSAMNYWQVLVRLGFVVESTSSIILTDFANRFLAADDLQQAEMIFVKLYSEFVAIAELANIYVEFPNTPQHLSDILEKLESKEMTTSPTAIENRIHWLASVGFVEETIPRTYLISEFGQKLASKHIQRKVNMTQNGKAYGDYLVTELRAAARYSNQHDRLEKVLAEIFLFIGYHTKRISGAGNTDVVVEARILEHQYSSILDGKSRKKGKVTEVNLDKILDHKTKHQTDYAMVIAEDFSDGGLIKYAEARGVTLMTIPLLCKWIELHCGTPLNLIDYRAFFETHGLLNEIPRVIQQKCGAVKKQQTVIRDIVLMIQEQTQDNLYIEQSLDALRTAISVSSRELLDKRLIVDAMQFLSHPVLNSALKNDDKSIVLAMSLSTVVLALRNLADQLEDAEENDW